MDSALDAAGLKNEAVREYVRHWAGVTGAERVEVVSAAGDARLIQEALDAGELLPAGEGRYYSRSYYKDNARSEERTIVAKNNPEDKGVYGAFNAALVAFRKTDEYRKILGSYGLSEESIQAAQAKNVADLCAGK